MNTSSTIQTIDGGVTATPGFRANGIHCGVRKMKKDLALLVSDVPASAAGVFTMNKAQAAPVLVDRIQLKRAEHCRAVVVNSGNANACTGERGLNDAWEMVRTVASALNISEEEVLVSSTGVIGQYLPIENIVSGIKDLSGQLSTDGAHAAAEAIMTTDTYPKELAVQTEIGGRTITIGVMAKGSGMIAPNMATMLAFVTTDVAIDTQLLRQALGYVADRTFNRISVDGDTSTNDMVIVLANGVAGNDLIAEENDEFFQFRDALQYILTQVSRMIARDGEGATKLIEVVVSGATSEAEAVQAARAVANSNLVKTAIHGCDANWGRILAAVGYSGIDFDPQMMSISLNDVPVLEVNYQIVLDEEKAKEALMRDEVVIRVDLHNGEESAVFWTCDLTKDYIHINASYRT